jgi:hypothetical protein
MPHRQDIDVTKEIPGYRRMLIHLTPDRDAASFYLKFDIDVTDTLAWFKAYEQETGKKMSMVVYYAACAGRVFHEYPKLNRYVSGHRVFQRSDVSISVSAKKALKDGAKVVLLKLPIKADDSPTTVLERFTSMLSHGRSGEELHQEKEVGLFLKLPPFMLGLFIKLAMWVDRRHWLPGIFVDPDPMFTSMVVANLGSIGMGAGYHHLYEWGNCPFFAVMGRATERPVVRDGEVVIRSILELKVSFDERVEDGLKCAIGLKTLKELMEDPTRWDRGITDLEGRPPDDLL